MPQFDIFPNPGRNREIVFLLQIQTTRLDSARDRVVIPLLRKGLNAPPDHGLTPHFIVLDQPVYADPLNLVTIQRSRLGQALATLQEADQGRIITAIDELIAR